MLNDIWSRVRTFLFSPNSQLPAYLVYLGSELVLLSTPRSSVSLREQLPSLAVRSLCAHSQPGACAGFSPTPEAPAPAPPGIGEGPREAVLATWGERWAGASTDPATGPGLPTAPPFLPRPSRQLRSQTGELGISPPRCPDPRHSRRAEHETVPSDCPPGRLARLGSPRSLGVHPNSGTRAPEGEEGPRSQGRWLPRPARKGSSPCVSSEAATGWVARDRRDRVGPGHAHGSLRVLGPPESSPVCDLGRSPWGPS